LRGPMFALSLIAALAGTPLRLAEAAYDMAREVAELGVGDGLEVPDGGVGDDSGATIKSDITHAPVTSTCVDNVPAAFTFAAGTSRSILERPSARTARFASGVPRVLAQLQCFLC
jgi:hypothetical protein